MCCLIAPGIAELAHRVAGGNDRRRQLVPGRDGVARGDVLGGYGSLGGDFAQGDDDVVLGVQADGARRIRGHGPSLSGLFVAATITPIPSPWGEAAAPLIGPLAGNKIDVLIQTLLKIFPDHGLSVDG